MDNVDKTNKKPWRQSMKRKNINRTLTVDFHDERTYKALCNDGKTFLEFVIAFILSLGFHLKHKSCCPGGTCLTRHSHYQRIRLNNVTIWRVQCKHCKAVFTVLPHFVLRYSSLKPEKAKQALLATYGGLSLELCAIVCNVSPMSIYRVLSSFGKAKLVQLLVRCGLPLPQYFQGDEKHSHCLGEKVYLPTIVEGRVIWHLGYTTDKSAQSFQESYGEFKDAALEVEPEYEPKGILTDSFESTIKSLGILFPKARIGNCLLHATRSVGQKLKSVTSSVRRSLKSDFYNLFKERNEPKPMKLFRLGQKLRRFAEKITKTTGKDNGTRIKEWIHRKKQGWFVLFNDSNMPAMSTCLDQAHNAIDRKLFMMKGFHHEKGNQKYFINGIALLYNVIPYQRRAKNKGKCGIEVQGGNLPTRDWFLNLQILTSGAFV